MALAGPLELSICTAYLNPGGFGLMADQLEALDGVRLMLGADPDVSTSKLRPLSDTYVDADRERLDRALEGQKKTMEEDRNLLGFEYDADENAKRLVRWLKTGKVQVRRYDEGFLHGKAWIVTSGPKSVIAGSSNFTQAGLSTNKELNLGQYQPYVVDRVKEWYDKLWDRAKDFDLAALFAARYDEHSPWLIYLRMLYERYGEEIEEERTGPVTGIHLTSFQEDGVARARRILQHHSGVLVADGVGLGKSFIAGALLREAIVENRQRALLVAPAVLRDGTWKRFQERHADFHFKCVSFEQLMQDRQLGGTGNNLEPLNEYALVVVDESHGFRNPDTDRSAALRKLLQGTPPKKLVLLTATPVNNSLWDLYYLINYFVKNDAAFADAGVTSLRDHFKKVAATSPDDLSPRQLFDILDAVAVRRTRHFIKKYYPDARIIVDGREEIIRFPQPKVLKVSHDLDAVLPGFFGRLAEALDPVPRDSTTFRVPEKLIGKVLTLARYIPSSYLNQPNPQIAEVQVSGLLLSGLLKRFESSSHAFGKTCRRLIKTHEAFLAALGKGHVLRSAELTAWVDTASDDSDRLADLLGQGDGASAYDVKTLKRHVEADLQMLREFAAEAEKVTPSHDPKLTGLVGELAKIAAEARSDGVGDEDTRDKRKVAVFTYYADTAVWINEFLERESASNKKLTDYKNRLALVVGDSSSRESAVYGFVPRSSESPNPDDKYDILVTTDVLAEGVNLQQARHIINYDLPWNPMRLVQRHGRIDRIGSPHTRVYLRCFFPDKQLDQLLKLEERLTRKLAAAAAAVGVESEVIPGSKVSDVNFTETREEIEKLRQQNPELFETSGERYGAESGEEYRQELRGGMSDSEMARLVRDLAWGSGSGKSANGGPPGYVFCARVGDHKVPQFRYVSYENPAKPEIIADTLSSLSHAHAEEQTARVLSDDVYRRAYDAWALAKRDVFDKWSFATHPANIQPSVPKAMRDAAEIVRSHPPEGLGQVEIDRLLDALEADYGVRTQRVIRSAIDSSTSPKVQGSAIAKAALSLGLEPAPAAKPLPVITPEDIHLICWMAIS
ncbi:MAG: helicase [Acidimicrobiia bacterium]|nr:helicase [Acidimicrobiia bacterium]